MRAKCILLLSLLAAILAAPAGAPGGRQHASADVDIYASSVQASCYRAKPDLCKIHVEPFTITVVSGRRLVYFQLLATRSGGGTQSVIYDFRPDLSNPAPLSGDTFTPTKVAQDFAARCGESYTVSLQGQDSGDPYAYNLATTTELTCPAGDYRTFLPRVSR